MIQLTLVGGDGVTINTDFFATGRFVDFFSAQVS
jgi:hypothetical protein